MSKRLRYFVTKQIIELMPTEGYITPFKLFDTSTIDDYKSQISMIQMNKYLHYEADNRQFNMSRKR